MRVVVTEILLVVDTKFVLSVVGTPAFVIGLGDVTAAVVAGIEAKFVVVRATVAL